MVLEDYNCVLCHPALKESLIHVFLACPFSRSCWATLGLVIQQPTYPLGTLVSFKNQQLPFFMKIIVTMSWSIWIVRNDAIFKQVQPSILHCKSIFKREFAQVILRAKNSLAPLFTQWLEGCVDFHFFLFLSLFLEELL